MITATSVMGLAVGIGLVLMTKKESITDRLGVLVLLAVGIGLRFGPIGDKVREATRGIGRWVTERHWDNVGPDIVALLPAILAIIAGAIVVGALLHGQAEALAVVCAVLLPILLTSVGDGTILDLIGQVASAITDLAGTLIDWLTQDVGGVVGGRG